MYLSLALKRLLYGQHFYSGLFAAVGVLGLALLAHALAGSVVALGVGIGAAGASVVDVPAPLHAKRADLLLAALGGGLVALLTLGVAPSVAGVGVVVMAVSFVSGMLGSFGQRTASLSFSVLFSLFLAVGVIGAAGYTPVQAACLVLVGGLLYLVYALQVGALLRYRTKHQALAETLFELAEYLRVLAVFYADDGGAGPNPHYAALAAQQARVAQKQQTARDIVFARVRSERDIRLADTLIDAIDLYEYLLSSHIERELLQRHFAGSDALSFLQGLLDKAAADVEQLAYAVLRNRKPAHRVSYKAELFALEHALAGGEGGAAFTALRTATRRLRHVLTRIEALRAGLDAVRPEEAARRRDLLAFVSPASYNPKLLVDQLRADSPVLRYAVRLSLAMGCAYLVSQVLPYSTHGYWILLTVGVVMRPNFSATRQRRSDRMIGNAIGCLIVAVLLQLHPPMAVLAAALFASVALGHTFVTLNYRITSAATCVMALLIIHFTHPGGFALAERLLDTAIGVVIAFGFSFVLPSWEHLAIPRQAAALLGACRDYADAILSTAGGEAGTDYRLARKRLLDATAALTGAFGRMQLEPREQQRAVAPLQNFVTASYLFAGYIAAIRQLLTEHRGELDERTLSMRLAECRADLQTALDRARAALDASEPRPMGEEAVAEGVEGVGGDVVDWSASALLDRRLRLIRQATAHLLAASRELGCAWRVEESEAAGLPLTVGRPPAC